MITRSKIVKIITNWIIQSEDYQKAVELNLDLKKYVEQAAIDVLTPEEKYWVENYKEFYISQKNLNEDTIDYSKEFKNMEYVRKRGYRLLNSYQHCKIANRYINVYDTEEFRKRNLILPGVLKTIFIDSNTPILIQSISVHDSKLNWKNFEKEYSEIAKEIKDRYYRLIEKITFLDKKVTALIETLHHKDLSLRILKNNYVELYNYSR